MVTALIITATDNGKQQICLGKCELNPVPYPPDYPLKKKKKHRALDIMCDDSHFLVLFYCGHGHACFSVQILAFYFHSIQYKCLCVGIFY
jgi:hypothetical protein